MEGWRYFCYAPVMSSRSADIGSSPFQWWTSGDFEMCFQYLIFMTASAALFGILSTYYAGRYSTRYLRVKRPLIVVVRLLLSVCIATNSVVEFGAAFWMNKQRPYAVLTAEAVYAVCWVCHAVAMWVFSTSVVYKGRGPLLLNSGWYLTLVATILHFRAIIRWTQHHKFYQYITPSDMYFSFLFRVTAYTHMGLQIVYGLSLLVGLAEARVDGTMKKHSRWKRTSRVVSIQHGDESEDEDDDKAREKRPLIHSRFHSEESSSYGTLTGYYRGNPNLDLFLMNAYEDHTNILSLLIFWWVWPLLKRGAMGYLENDTDLPLMPKSLQTSRIREKFRKVLLRKQCTSDIICSSTDQSESGGGRLSEEKGAPSAAGASLSRVEYEYYLDSEVLLHSFTRSTPVPYTCTPDPPSNDQAMGSGQSPDSARSPPMAANGKNAKKSSKQTSLLFLFSALNRAFGLHYYPLGLLKLTTDLLGFAGPLLLYQLVSFIENKKVSSQWPHCAFSSADTTYMHVCHLV